jgi:GTP1/Obg family GTP-binding protein
VHKTEDNLAQLSEEKLNIYCEILKDRQSELQHEIVGLQSHPKFLPVVDYVFLNEKRALAEIKRKKQNIESIRELFSRNINGLKELNKKKEIADFISAFHSEFVFDQEDTHFFFDDDDFKW